MLNRQLLFQSLHSPAWFWFSVVVVLVTVWLIVTLLRYERRLVPRHIGYLLLLLRVLVAGTVFVALLEPVISWTIERRQTGRILVAVDLSDSMRTIDKHAQPAEKLRWARSLGLIGNAAIDARLDRWMADFEAGREPQWVLDSEVTDGVDKLELARIRRENLDGVFQDIDQLSRLETTRRLLETGPQALLPQLRQRGDVELLIFAGKSQSAGDMTLEHVIAEPPTTLLPGTTDVTTPLSEAVSQLSSVPIAGVVVFTDGRDHGTRDPLTVARRLGDVTLPIYPVVIGSQHQPRDLAVAGLDYPLTVFQGDQPLLNATFNTAGFEGETIDFVLRQTEPDSAQTQTVRIEGPVTNLEFELPADEVGRREFTVDIPAQPGESTPDNNLETFAMTVVDDRARVLLLEGEARWEFRFIHNAYARDERVGLEEVVFDQPFLNILPDTFYSRQLKLPPDAASLEGTPFAEVDLVIIGDVDSSDLPENAWELLDRFVGESGGTVVFVAGRRHFPLAHQSATLARLLPVTDLRVTQAAGDNGQKSPSARGFGIRLTPEGASETFLQFAADTIENQRVWSQLPGHVWGLFGQAKPGASVLAYALQPGERPTLDVQRRSPVIVHQHYGAGQVLWIGIDSTWRWRFRVGDKYHHRFWGQLARWATNNKSVAGNEFVKFGPDRADITEGEVATIRARWSETFLKSAVGLKAYAEVWRPIKSGGEELVSRVDLAVSDRHPLLFEGPLAGLSVGEYQVKLLVENADVGPETISADFVVHRQPTMEGSDMTANRDLLLQMADASHGRLFEPHELQELPPLLDGISRDMSAFEETTLWDHWLLLVVLITLLTAEWVLRKLNGLP